MSKWLLKPYIFNPTLTAHMKNVSKSLYSARVIVESVFVILKVRCRDLLTMLFTNRENISNTIISCFALHNFCYINGDEYLVDDLFYEIMNQKRLSIEGDCFTGGERSRTIWKNLHKWNLYPQNVTLILNIM